MLPGGERVPELPDEAPVPFAAEADADAAPPSEGASSRLGGALLIGAAVVLVAAVLAFVFLRDGERPGARRRRHAGDHRDADRHARARSATS